MTLWEFMQANCVDWRHSRRAFNYFLYQYRITPAKQDSDEMRRLGWEELETANGETLWQRRRPE